jgi:hypothetical protein
LLNKIIVFLLILVISTGYNNTPTSNAIPTSSNAVVSTSEELLVIQKVNIEAEYKGKFVQLSELIPEIQQSENYEEQNPLPRIKNNTIMRVNATYSTLKENSYSIVIWHFSVDVYEVVSAGSDTFNGSLASSAYRYENPAEVVLPPNSSKAEALTFHLSLPSTGTYKFSFRTLCQIHTGVEDSIDVLYHENITFELVRNYDSPPYIIIYTFVAVVFTFIAMVLLGLYGNRKYKDLDY